MFQSCRKKRRSVALAVDVLEERCTPAVMLTPQAPLLQFQVGMMQPLVPVQTGPSVLVRTDLFGGGHGEPANSAADDALAVQEPIAAPESAFDLQPPQKSETESAARPDEAQQPSDDAPAKTLGAEPIELCVVVELD